MIQEAYNRETFLRFLRTFLPDDYVQNVVQRTNPAHKFTQSVMELGKCASLDLMVFEIHHSSSNDARVGIAQETFRLMNSLACRRALIVFIPENSDQWRFSLLEITLEWDEKKINRTFSNPRRHSYLLGKNAHTKTPEQYIIEKGRIRAQRVDGKDLTAWEDLQHRFSVEALTKEFYDQLYHWYLWAVEPSTGVTFPNLVNTSQDDRDDIAIKIIRLITRLLFVWFIKQKKLVPEQIFDEAQLDKILANFDPQSEKDGKYYNAILQNLFFATLNNEVNKRRFMTDPFQGKSDSFGVKQLFRDSLKASWFKISHDEVIALFHHVPFMNCGLFECLDKYAKSDIGQENDLFLDGFSSRDSRQDGHLKYRAFVPNRLFFAEEHYENVTVEEKGQTKTDSVKVMGLIRLLKLYNFTVQENTPAEVEVSLDPELLGQVFENLLAAYNPETKESARKSTGSFYTPRPIVEYMVNESLVAYLKTKVGPHMEPIYRSLISYEDTPEEMLPVEKKRIAILNALYECKILDPACGSGAFPMGMLQQMVHITRKLDSEFDPYLTKLRIIDNCIYGSDIQPIAMLISKLRFFISLICEQDESRINFNDPENNFGINTLPNLETKFVAANSLLKADVRNYAKDECWEDPQLVILKNELLDIRERHFGAKTQRTKLRLREEDEKKREEIRQYIIENAGKPDPVLLQMYEDRIKHLTAERKMYEGENIVEEVVNTQASLFEDAQPQVVRKDVNKVQRDKIDAEIAGLRRSITKEQNKRNPIGFNAAIQQVTNWNPYDQIKAAPFFDPDWMFGVKNGFDIVIGNPPYVLVSKDDNLSNTYKETFTFSRDGKTNLYQLFYEIAFKLLSNKGVLCYITPNTYLTANYCKTLRSHLLNKTTIKEIIEYTEKDKVFANVTQAVTTIVVTNQCTINNKIKIRTAKQGVNICDQETLKLYNILIPLNSVILALKENNKLSRLTEYFDIHQGEINLTSKRSLFSTIKKVDSLPMWRGDNVGKYNPISLPIEWCDLRGSDKRLYNSKRIVTQQVSNQSQLFRTKAFISPERYICGNSTNYLLPYGKDELELFFFLSIINSKVFNYYFNYFSSTNHITADELKNIPVPAFEGNEKLAETLRRYIIKDVDTYEDELDILVYLLYKLTYDEVRIIDPNIETIISEAEYNKRLENNA